MKLRIPETVKKMIQTLSPEEVKEKMGLIRSAIDSIFGQTELVMDYKQLYDTTFKLVTNKFGEQLYKNVKESIEHHTKGICEGVDKNTDEVFLQKLLAVWEKYRRSVSKIRDILLYLDEHYVDKSQSHEKKILTVYEQGIAIFRTDVLTKLAKRVQRLINKIITRERDGEAVADKFMLKNLTQMMVEVDKEKVYTAIFESEFIKESKEYYNKEAQRFFESSTAVGYLNRVKQRLGEELERANRCLDPDTKPKIEQVIKDEMIERYKELVVKKEGSGVVIMLENKREEELALVYEVLSIVQGALQPTIEMVRDFAIQEGEKIIKDPKKDEQPKQLVMDVIDLRVHFDELLLKSFSQVTKGLRVRDKDFSKAIKEAFDHIVNSHKRFPEYLSLLVDGKIAGAGMEEDKLDTFFDKVIMVFRHVSEKDVFEKYYKNHLAKRLLSSKNASDDDEKTFLGKLKQEFGYQFTAKLEGMFKDIKVSSELMQDWKNFVTQKMGEKAPFDLSVQVLTHVYWPVTSNARCDLPELQLKQMCDTFGQFYTQKHNGRKITWQYNMGDADLKLNGYSKPFELNCTTYQMAILILFNENAQLTMGEIAEKTKIPAQDLKRELVALLLPVSAADKTSKVLVREEDLKKEEEGEKKKPATAEKTKKTVTIDNNTVFKPNDTFKSSKIKNKVKEIGGGKKEQSEVDETNEKILEERKWICDAVIVRIMKMRKKLDHRSLVNEVVEQLVSRFPVDAMFIKKRIENLIDREYLERAEGSRDTYHYLA